MKKPNRDAAIIADLRNKNLTYADVMSKHRIGVERVIALSKQHGLTRPRGRKPKSVSTEQE